MSTKTPATELNATNEELAEFIATPEVPETPAAPKKKKNVFYRLLALLLAIAPIALFYFLDLKTLAYQEGAYVLENNKLLDLFIKLFSEEGAAVTKLFDIVPLTMPAGILGISINVFLYLIPVSMVVCVFAALIYILGREVVMVVNDGAVFRVRVEECFCSVGSKEKILIHKLFHQNFSLLIQRPRAGLGIKYISSPSGRVL